MAFAVLVVIVVVRCGFHDSAPIVDAPSPPIVDARIVDAPLADAPIDAAPPPKKRVPKPVTKPTRPAPTPTARPVTPPPEPPTPVTPPPEPATPGARQCVHPANPAGCPAKEPNVNRPCDAEGVHCLYGVSCCPFEYVCTNGAFEVWISSCP